MAVFQAVLSHALINCGQAGISIDGQFGRRSRTAILRLTGCPGWDDMARASDDPLQGVVDSTLWHRLLPDGPPPDASVRAIGLVLAHERTDYDRVEWNYDTDDDLSALTWGPFGATAGHGNEIRGILDRLETTAPELIDQEFGREAEFVRHFISAPADQGYELLRPVHAANERKRIWTNALQALGGLPEGRAAFDWYAFESGKWLTPGLRRLYSLVPFDAATETDYAFFLDLATHASVSSSRIRESAAALEAEFARLGRSLVPAERRRVIARVFANRVNQRWRNDRIGRNVVFYVDGIGEAALSDEESSAWLRRSRYRASNYGLSDDRVFDPKILD